MFAYVQIKYCTQFSEHTYFQNVTIMFTLLFYKDTQSY